MNVTNDAGATLFTLARKGAKRSFSNCRWTPRRATQTSRPPSPASSIGFVRKPSCHGQLPAFHPRGPRFLARFPTSCPWQLAPFVGVSVTGQARVSPQSPGMSHIVAASPAEPSARFGCAGPTLCFCPQQPSVDATGLRPGRRRRAHWSAVAGHGRGRSSAAPLEQNGQ